MATENEEMVGISMKRSGIADKMEPESTDIFTLYKDASIAGVRSPIVRYTSMRT
jgi:hypothetical protein